MVEVEIINALLAHIGTAALVGTRVWPIKLKERATMPAITVQRISGASPDDTHDDTGSSLTLARYQVTAWGATALVCLQVAAQVRAALRHYRGTDLKVSFLEDAQDRHEGETGLYSRITDVIAWVKE